MEEVDARAQVVIAPAEAAWSRCYAKTLLTPLLPLPLPPSLACLFSPSAPYHLHPLLPRCSDSEPAQLEEQSVRGNIGFGTDDRAGQPS